MFVSFISCDLLALVRAGSGLCARGGERGRAARGPGDRDLERLVRRRRAGECDLYTHADAHAHTCARKATQHRIHLIRQCAAEYVERVTHPNHFAATHGNARCVYRPQLVFLQRMCRLLLVSLERTWNVSYARHCRCLRPVRLIINKRLLLGRRLAISRPITFSSVQFSSVQFRS